MKAILSIHSQVAGARVGNSIAAFAAERLGAPVYQIPTTLLGRRPDRGPPGGARTPRETLASILDALDADGKLATVGAVFSGYLADPDQVAVILDAVERVKAANPKAVYVCDPIIGDAETGRYVSTPIADAIAEGLVPRADWITPNFFEFGLIAGAALDGVDAARAAARRFGKPVLLTSIPLDGRVGVLYAAPGGDWLVDTPRLPAAPKGAGDLLAALFVARRLLGQAPAVALEASVGAVYDVIVRTIAAGADDLLIPEAHELLAEPQTWPRAQALGV